jgi:SAM-dependent methyltransferase
MRISHRRCGWRSRRSAGRGSTPRATDVANFVPLKQHMLYCLDRFIERFGLRGPFLEVGCGKGDVSAHLAARGWPGLAIDFSDAAIALAARTLQPFPRVAVRRQALDEVEGTYRCIILWDVLEHIDDDAGALRTLARLLEPGGQLLIAVPSNPREWRWDDDFYGHFRRYTVDGLSGKLADAGLEAQAFWDFTFPVFWGMRRIYTRLKKPAPVVDDKAAATKASATVNAWDVPIVARLLERASWAWRPLQVVQYRLFRNATARGHEFFALARKPS